ncbi:hypothetical protein THAOC_17313 [Thalassiosira oceanica]|uniref:Uncharacterized protein n=1 Tax=Thalassiosira oceanica TaxID=159749 RepID=K0SA03_THAOC|nr:hypothetical protein THAOC_17313 [Thalassiosira oceanica]|eukprot:EJK62090.1 hypothetical protein THAOC_17313 [Thalassiosira oceanica]
MTIQKFGAGLGRMGWLVVEFANQQFTDCYEQLNTMSNRIVDHGDGLGRMWNWTGWELGSNISPLRLLRQREALFWPFARASPAARDALQRLGKNERDPR